MTPIGATRRKFIPDAPICAFSARKSPALSPYGINLRSGPLRNLRQLHPIGVIYINDRNPRRRAQFPIKQRVLRGEVVLHGAVIIEVILGQVGEDRNIVRNP